MTIKKAFLLLVFCGTLVIAKAQTADEVVNKYVEALGGKEKLASLKTLVREGSLNTNGLDIPLTLTAEQDKGFKMELDVMGTVGYVIVTPKEGWKFMPFQGATTVEKMPEDEVTEGQDDLDIQGELFNYAAKGSKVELLSKENLEGIDIYKLQLTLKNGQEKTMYIDVATNYLLRTEVIENGDIEFVIYKNYKKTTDGYIIAHKLIRQEGSITFSKISTNTKLADDIFKPGK